MSPRRGSWSSSSKTRESLIFIAGGGTGGHVYPALAIGKSIQKISPSTEVHFVGTQDGLETQIIPKEGQILHLILGGKLNQPGPPWKKIIPLFRSLGGFFQSFALLWRYRPKFVLGVGGYASGPFVLAAALFGVRTGIWEANAQPGLANRWLAPFVDEIFVVFEAARSILSRRNKNIHLTGMPVREEIERSAEENVRKTDPKIDQKTELAEEPFRILCVGGSQGSKLLNETLYQSIQLGSAPPSPLHGTQILHQVGAREYSRWSNLSLIQPPHLTWTVRDFIYDMPDQYRWADLIVCRGGASTIAEISAFGLVPIIVPLPLADQHQERNAEVVSQAEAGICILQKDLTPQGLIDAIVKLRNNPSEREQMSLRLRALFSPKAAHQIGEWICRTDKALDSN